MEKKKKKEKNMYSQDSDTWYEAYRVDSTVLHHGRIGLTRDNSH